MQNNNKMRESCVGKFCQICGDIGVGRNFGAITCESCKAFFRRHSHKEKKFFCKYDGICKIDVNLRKCCKKCRLSKCFAMGMKKELIHNDRQNALRRLNTERNRLIKNLTTNSNISINSITSDDSIFQNDFYLKIFEHNKQVTESVIGVDKCYKYLYVNHSLAPFSPPNTSLIPIIRPINTCNELNDTECKRLAELCSSSNIFRYPKSQTYFKVKNMLQFYTLWGNRIEMDTKDIVSFTKNIGKHLNVCTNDEIALIKYGAMEIIVLRYNFFYDKKAEHWNIVMDDNYSFVFPMEMLKPEKRDIYYFYKCYLNKIIPEWDQDLIILDLLTAIVLFNPKRPHLINRDIIERQQYMYIYLLERYLMSRYRVDHQWRPKMAAFMNALIDLRIVSQIEIENGVEGYLQYFGPIFREILGK
ncbi:nuclear hormone receptor HR96-like [Oppia nitens]|uniref:nuclear hormone receptor HR96-like n=1 Tax=Oppia nitens TaxID=1686743 RepID=UPI0023DB52DF|nr:nuclear hormone receptor HR96-like [Oppia nitens]